MLQDMPSTGYFGAPGQLSWDLRFARKTPLPDGGEQVVLVTDRRIGFWEATRQPASRVRLPFTVIELRLNPDGEGEGKMSLATKVIHDKDKNYDHARELPAPAGHADQGQARTNQADQLTSRAIGWDDVDQQERRSSRGEYHQRQ
jgi:hypothetical protein